MKEEIVEAPSAMPPPRTVSPAVGAAAAETFGERASHYRWVICGLLFFATTINYVDRQVLGILSKDLQAALGWKRVAVRQYRRRL